MTSASNDVSIDHALTLLLADRTEEALRWAAGIVQRDPQSAAALVMTSRLLQRMGRTRSATGGLCLAFRQAVTRGDLPLAMAAIDGLREIGLDVEHIQRSAAASFCLGSSRIDSRAQTPPGAGEELFPLSPFLTGPALASRATEILRSAHEASEGGQPARVPPMPVFGALPVESLSELLGAFRVIEVSAGYTLVEEGSQVSAVYVLVRGQVEMRRRAARDQVSVPVSRMEEGAFFGETALLGDVPSAYTVVATRPCMVMVADREALEAVSARYPSVSTELEIHCRRSLVANLGRTADLLQAIPAARRSEIIDALDLRVFAAGAKIIAEGEEVDGIYLIASGEVTVAAREEAETVLLATLAAGDTVGDVEVVLCRKAATDAVAMTQTATLFLQRSYFAKLMESDPATAQGMYLSAVRKAAVTAQAMESPSSPVDAYHVDNTDISLQDPMRVDVSPLFASTPKPPATRPPPLPTTPRDTGTIRPAADPAARGRSPIPRRADPAPVNATPSSLAPTATSSKPGSGSIAFSSVRPPQPVRTRGTPSLFTACAISLAVGAALTVLVPRATPLGSAAAGAASPGPPSTLSTVGPAAVATEPSAVAQPSVEPSASVVSGPAASSSQAPPTAPKLAAASATTTPSRATRAKAPAVPGREDLPRPRADHRTGATSDDEFGDRR